MTFFSINCFTVACLLLSVVLVVSATETRILSSVIRGTEGNEDIFGLARVTESVDGTVIIEAAVEGLPDGDHGFHVHVYGDVVGQVDGTAAGGHYNPFEVNHAGPDQDERHVGDLGNIISVNGMATYNRTFADSSRPTIVTDFVNSIIGRSFVIHADPDDLTTQPTGNAGARLAVGIIGIGNHELAGGDAVEVIEHITSDDFEVPETLICKILGEGIEGFGKVNIRNGAAELSANVSGLSQGDHGFHIHWYGEEYEFTTTNLTGVARDLGRAGGHYNPTDVMHGLPPTSPRHFGDGGNIAVGSDGTGTIVVTLDGVSDLRSLVGRTCLVHADPDDGEDPAGNAGARIAAGQLGYANPTTDANFQVPGETPAETSDAWSNVASSIPVVVTSLVLFLN